MNFENYVFVLINIFYFIINHKIYLVKNFILVCFLLTMIVSSCKKDSNIELSTIDGTWEMFFAKRNGKKTSTLDKSFFKFENGKMAHNINGDTLELDYTVDKNIVSFEDDLLDKLTISHLSADTLHMNTKISGMKFEFKMKRKNE